MEDPLKEYIPREIYYEIRDYLNFTSRIRLRRCSTWYLEQDLCYDPLPPSLRELCIEDTSPRLTKQYLLSRWIEVGMPVTEKVQYLFERWKTTTGAYVKLGFECLLYGYPYCWHKFSIGAVALDNHAYYGRVLSESHYWYAKRNPCSKCGLAGYSDHFSTAEELDSALPGWLSCVSSSLDNRKIERPFGLRVDESQYMSICTMIENGLLENIYDSTTTSSEEDPCASGSGTISKMYDHAFDITELYHDMAQNAFYYIEFKRWLGSFVSNVDISFEGGRFILMYLGEYDTSLPDLVDV